MKILIFLFAMITFMLMASDPRRDYFEQDKMIQLRKIVINYSQSEKKKIRKNLLSIVKTDLTFCLRF